jgi:hypothetical protein
MDFTYHQMSVKNLNHIIYNALLDYVFPSVRQVEDDDA